jgi:hypothetical protein
MRGDGTMRSGGPRQMGGGGVRRGRGPAPKT